MQRRSMVKMVVVTLVLGGSLLLGMGALFAADKTPAGKAEGAKGPKAIIQTKFGDMDIVFFPEKAPSMLKISSRWRNPVSTTERSFIG